MNPVNDDLLCLKPRPRENDIFTSWIQGPLLNHLHDYLSRFAFSEKLVNKQNEKETNIYARAGMVE